MSAFISRDIDWSTNEIKAYENPILYVFFSALIMSLFVGFSFLKEKAYKKFGILLMVSICLSMIEYDRFLNAVGLSALLSSIFELLPDRHSILQVPFAFVSRALIYLLLFFVKNRLEKGALSGAGVVVLGMSVMSLNAWYYMFFDMVVSFSSQGSFREVLFMGISFLNIVLTVTFLMYAEAFFRNSEITIRSFFRAPNQTALSTKLFLQHYCFMYAMLGVTFYKFYSMTSEKYNAFPIVLGEGIQYIVFILFVTTFVTHLSIQWCRKYERPATWFYMLLLLPGINIIVFIFTKFLWSKENPMTREERKEEHQKFANTWTLIVAALGILGTVQWFITDNQRETIPRLLRAGYTLFSAALFRFTQRPVWVYTIVGIGCMYAVFLGLGRAITLNNIPFYMLLVMLIALVVYPAFHPVELDQRYQEVESN
ncbi:hypothetical protein GCM10023331_13670 [Algivirga pacifica]|uniref:Beta-carotene 15,15'-monooxygenase n=2 Tax=Algivirga pacifica TaxID=1162670 RepID=A0ABP9DBS6_9BACT